MEQRIIFSSRKFRILCFAGVFVLGVVSAIPDECLQEKDEGACGGRAAPLPRWYYNTATERCETFPYYGCGGNANRWLDQTSCREYCEVKDGQCPTPNPNVLNLCVNLCGFDTDCPEEEKCCAHSCGTYCTAPAHPKTGTCPHPNSFNRVCVHYHDQCQDNSECKGEQICCLVAGCGKECMNPAGFCPALPEGTFGTCDERCPRDGKCPGDQLCCSNGCGHLCKDPAPPCQQAIVVGPCEAAIASWGYNIDTEDCEFFYYGGCEGNDNRYDTRDACCSACGCKKPGTCPDPNSFNRVCIQYHDQCQDNSECKGEQICCLVAGCGKECMDPTRPGFCPALRKGTIGTCDERCPLNGKCPGDQLCCSNGCGHLCKDPAPPCQQAIVVGPCDATVPSWGYNINTEDCEFFNYGGCEGNDNRYDTRDACCRACGCKKPGNCPDPNSFNRVCIQYHDQCQDNSECKGEQICCLVAGCGKECMDPARPGPCEQPIVIGPCEGYYPSWGYNALTGVCEKFVYGGCGGNDNRFISKDECCKGCGCSKPGFCPAVIGAGTCQEQCSFDVECKGNDKCCSNGCGHVCVPPASPCEQPIAPGPCKALNPSWGFNPQSGQCEAFNYGGCQGNDNRYPTFEDCCSACGGPTSCVCEAPLKIGPCRAAINRWYFNIKSGECEEFSWGGCQPNANNFPDEISCKARCGKRDVTCPTPPPPSLPGGAGCRFTCRSDGECKHLDVCCPQGCPGTYCARPEPKDACDLPINSGECKANIQRWGYDQQQGKCVQFTYGGCLGNINNFATERQCQVACDCDLDRCYQGIDPGPCVHKRPEYKWGFDLKTGQCERFDYGGHGGNDNRFCSKRQCKRKCRHAIKRQDHVCYQSIEANPLILCVWCNPHWAYAPCKNECVQFCRCGTDTDNAFKTKDECEEHCVRDEDDDNGRCEDDDDDNDDD